MKFAGGTNAGYILLDPTTGAGAYKIAGWENGTLLAMGGPVAFVPGSVTFLLGTVSFALSIIFSGLHKMAVAAKYTELANIFCGISAGSGAMEIFKSKKIITEVLLWLAELATVGAGAYYCR